MQLRPLDFVDVYNFVNFSITFTLSHVAFLQPL